MTPGSAGELLWRRGTRWKEKCVSESPEPCENHSDKSSSWPFSLHLGVSMNWPLVTLLSGTESFRIQMQSLLEKAMTLVTMVWMENRRASGGALDKNRRPGCLPRSGICLWLGHLTILSPVYSPAIQYEFNDLCGSRIVWLLVVFEARSWVQQKKSHFHSEQFYDVALTHLDG